jgi:threonyl-tRNA synthetase
VFIIGEKERANQSVAVRRHKEGDKGPMPLDEAIEKLKAEILSKS